MPFYSPIGSRPLASPPLPPPGRPFSVVTVLAVATSTVPTN